MADCKLCTTLTDRVTEDYTLLKTVHLTAILSPDQAYLGRSTIITNRHVPRLSAISEAEILDYRLVVQELENALTRAFDAQQFNWGCLMNKDPHVHWHFRPRYVMILNIS